KRVAGFEVLFDLRPHGALGGVGEEHLDDGAALDGFLDVEERLAGDPAVADGAVPTAGFGALADDDLEAVVAEVERLGGALDTVADDRDGFAFQDLARPRHGEFLAGDDFYLRAAKIDDCHSLCLSVLVKDWGRSGCARFSCGAGRPCRSGSVR